jgi:hypothetical protein
MHHAHVISADTLLPCFLSCELCQTGTIVFLDKQGRMRQITFNCKELGYFSLLKAVQKGWIPRRFEPLLRLAIKESFLRDEICLDDVSVVLTPEPAEEEPVEVNDERSLRDPDFEPEPKVVRVN